MQARMAILKAARQLAVEANVHVHIRKFSVINQVGAVGIDAKLDCDAFASTHSATSHYDRASFVGMRVWCDPLTGYSLDTHWTLTAHCAQVWHGVPVANTFAAKSCARTPFSPPRPAHAARARAQYSTGKANLPGSTRQRDLLTSFARMVSELLRHSDKPEVCERIPERLRLCHRPKHVTRDDAPVLAHSKSNKAAKMVPRMSDLFVSDADWQLEPLSAVTFADADEQADDDLMELAGF